MVGPAWHRPVLRQEVLDLLAPADRAVLVDCTVGTGGHAEEMLAASRKGVLIGMDLDEASLAAAKDRLKPFAGRFRLFQANFADVAAVLAEADVKAADALLADLGLASGQLDDPSRGFGFTTDGPLDMRMDPRAAATAGDLVNKLSERELADLIYRLGEERYSRRIARAIVAGRRNRPILRTRRLAEVIASAIPARARAARRGVHPATRTFQALRIAVNDELTNLDRLLAALPNVLSTGGRAAIISFHSLEDGRVKRAFASWAASGQATVLTRKPIVPSDMELSENPRSRSAKLRAVEKAA